MLFQSHLDFTHYLWKSQLTLGCTALDATAGRGIDTLFLASLLFPHSKAKLIALDIQEKAILATKKRLTEHGYSIDGKQLQLHNHCHRDVRLFLEPEEAHLITYNLGYLPGGDKNITTLTSTTLQSIESALLCLALSGMICITFYPGHPQGADEKAELIPKLFAISSCKVSLHRFSLSPTSPCVLIMQRMT